MSFTVFDQLSESREPVSCEIGNAFGIEVEFSEKILSLKKWIMPLDIAPE